MEISNYTSNFSAKNSKQSSTSRAHSKVGPSVESKKLALPLPLPKHSHSLSTNSNSQKSSQSNKDSLGQRPNPIPGRNDENLRRANLLQSVRLRLNQFILDFVQAFHFFFLSLLFPSIDGHGGVTYRNDMI